jgi:hypothetical protein
MKCRGRRVSAPFDNCSIRTCADGAAKQAADASRRYLSLVERLQIAHLLALALSMPLTLAAELGRNPSTVKRELDRHRDTQGRHLPCGADHNADLTRRRPREHKLVANTKLRLLSRSITRSCVDVGILQRVLGEGSGVGCGQRYVFVRMSHVAAALNTGCSPVTGRGFVPCGVISESMFALGKIELHACQTACGR